MIICSDGLTGINEAITIAFPKNDFPKTGVVSLSALAGSTIKNIGTTESALRIDLSQSRINAIFGVV